jgi:hypothetical protein
LKAAKYAVSEQKQENAMLTALFRTLEVRVINDEGDGSDCFIPVGVVVALNQSGPFGTAYVRISRDCPDLPSHVIVAELVLFDQLRAPGANLSLLEVPEQYGRFFRLSPPNQTEVADNEEGATAYVFYSTVPCHPFYERTSLLKQVCTELPRAAA